MNHGAMEMHRCLTSMSNISVTKVTVSLVTLESTRIFPAKFWYMRFRAEAPIYECAIESRKAQVVHAW